MCSVSEVQPFDRHLPITVRQYETSSKGECRLDEVPLEVAPCDNSNDEWLPDDVELNTVTINSMSIDGKSVETDGTRGRN